MSKQVVVYSCNGELVGYTNEQIINTLNYMDESQWVKDAGNTTVYYVIAFT